MKIPKNITIEEIRQLHDLDKIKLGLNPEKWNQEEPFELKHINRHKPCAACEKMYRVYIKQLETQIEVLTEALRMKHLTEPIKIQVECPLKGRMGQCTEGKCFHVNNQ